MSGPYTRVSHSDNFSDGSATDGTVVIDAVEAGLEAVETTVAGLTTAGVTWAQMPAGAVCFMVYNTGTSSYPTRATSRTDIYGLWQGPSAPPTTTGYALAGDGWVNTTP